MNFFCNLFFKLQSYSSCQLQGFGDDDVGGNCPADWLILQLLTAQTLATCMEKHNKTL